MLTNLIHFLLGAGVLILLIGALVAVWAIFGPKEKAEALTLNAIDDIIYKTNLAAFKEGQPVIAYGTVDNDAAIVGFNPEQLKANDFSRPRQCGARSNSCICAIKGKDKVLKCKGFLESKVSEIASGSGKQLIIKGEKSFTLRMTLAEKKLTAEELVA